MCKISEDSSKDPKQEGSDNAGNLKDMADGQEHRTEWPTPGLQSWEREGHESFLGQVKVREGSVSRREQTVVNNC